MGLRQDANEIISYAIQNSLPDEAVRSSLKKISLEGERIYLIGIGKAAWQMAKATSDVLGNKIIKGIVITKYEHGKGNLPNIEIYEAGHPIPDNNSYNATERVIEFVREFKSGDTLLFLISGGGSALFESPNISAEEMEFITEQLLSSGADIVEINTIRKRLSKVKGGKFAKLCEPANIKSIILSDIIDNPLDMIASGPTVPDSTTKTQVVNIQKKYNLQLSNAAKECLESDPVRVVKNVENIVIGSVQQLCHFGKKKAENLGYKTIFLTDCVNCEAKEVGRFLACIGKSYKYTNYPIAFVLGGETVVHLKGKGKGGRNQEIALAAAKGLAGIENVALFSIGSDGTDGPTDAAGGYCDGSTYEALKNLGIDPETELMNNNAYNALSAINGLIKTGPTGTNVNDLTILLIS